jgi:DNA-binding transcriptional regulator YiaG
MKKNPGKPSRYSDLAQELREWKSGKRKLRTTLLDDGGGRTVFRASAPELDERERRAIAFKKIRIDLALSQPEMAKAMHVGTGTVRNWEYERRMVPEAMLILAELLRDLPAVRKRLLAA